MSGPTASTKSTKQLIQQWLQETNGDRMLHRNSKYSNQFS